MNEGPHPTPTSEYPPPSPRPSPHFADAGALGAYLAEVFANWRQGAAYVVPGGGRRHGAGSGWRMTRAICGPAAR